MKFDTCTDESLLLMARSQNADAYCELTKRYFNKKKLLCSQASAALSCMFDQWDLNHAFYLAFNASIKSFSLGEGTFHSYLVRCLRNSLIREAEKLRLFKNVPTVSLDFQTSSDGEETLHDVIQDTDEEDPRMYVNYLEEVKSFSKMKENIDDEILQVARLKIDGCKYTEIAEILAITPKRASRDYEKYEELVKGIVFGK